MVSIRLAVCAKLGFALLADSPACFIFHSIALAVFATQHLQVQPALMKP